MCDSATVVTQSPTSPRFNVTLHNKRKMLDVPPTKPKVSKGTTRSQVHACLSPCGEVEDMVKNAKENGKISFAHRPNLSEQHAREIAAALQRLPIEQKLSKLKLRNCGITGCYLNTILQGTEKRKIKGLNLSANKGMDMGEVKKLVEHFECEELDMSNTQLDEIQIEILGDMQLKALKLKCSAFNGPIAKTLATLLNNGLEELILYGSKISVEQLKDVAGKMNPEINLKSLDLSHVVLKKEGIEAVSQIVNKTRGMKRLVLSDCELDVDLLDDLQECTKKKIAALIISSNPKLSERGIAIMAKLAAEVACEEMDISCNSLYGKNIEELLLAKPPKQQVRHLSIDENPCDDWSAVAQLVTNWKVEILDASECRLSAGDITTFTESLGDHKLESVDFSHQGAIIYQEKRKALKLLQSKCERVIYESHEELNMAKAVCN